MRVTSDMPRRIPAQSFANKNLTTVVSLFSVSWPSATPALRNLSPPQRTSQSHSLTVTLGPSTGECVCPDGLHCDPPSPALQSIFRQLRRKSLCSRLYLHCIAPLRRILSEPDHGKIHF